MADELSECDSLSKSDALTITNLKSVIIDDSILLKNTMLQIALEKKKEAVWVKDNELISGQLHDRNKQVRMLKVGLFGVSAVAIVTNVYLLLRQ